MLADVLIAQAVPAVDVGWNFGEEGDHITHLPTAKQDKVVRHRGLHLLGGLVLSFGVLKSG